MLLLPIFPVPIFCLSCTTHLITQAHIKETGAQYTYFELNVCLQHFLAEGQRRRLPEVYHLRLVVPDVVDQHHPPTACMAHAHGNQVRLNCVEPFENSKQLVGTHPPIPEVCGWITPRHRAAAMAASTLDPCLPRTSKPRDVHWDTSVTTAPWLKIYNQIEEISMNTGG